MLAAAAALWASPTARKLLGYGIAVAAVAFGIWYYGHTRYNAGKTDERVKITKEAEKQKKKEWEPREAQIIREKPVIIEDRKSAAAAIAQNAQFHQQLEGMLSSRVDEILREKEAADAAAIMLNPSERVAAIRALSGELAAVPSPIY